MCNPQNEKGIDLDQEFDFILEVGGNLYTIENKVLKKLNVDLDTAISLFSFNGVGELNKLWEQIGKLGTRAVLYGRWKNVVYENKTKEVVINREIKLEFLDNILEVV